MAAVELPRLKGTFRQPLDPVLVQQCKDLYLQDTPFASIAAITGVKRSTIETWSTTKGWSRVKRERLELTEVTRNPSNELLERESLRLKARTAKALHSQLDKIERIKKMENAGQGQVATLKTMIDGAAKVFGWSESSGVNVQVNVMNGARSRPAQVTPGDPSIAVSSTPVEP